MDETTSTIVNSNKNLNSNAAEFYKDYWVAGEKISKDREELSDHILTRYFPDGVINYKILEIGIGGEGGIVNTLKDKNEIFGIDVSDSAIELCKKLGVEVKKVNLDIDTIPFPDNYFDIIFAFEVFEHFANPQHAIEEINRTLKENGILLISTPNRFTYHWPRLFYPNLFDKNEFFNFLIINNFVVKLNKDKYLVNAYRNTIIDYSQKGWSNYYFCNKIANNNSLAHFNNGLYFWNLKDENGLRLYPIEAIECFRKSLTINNNLFVRCFFTRALVYRGVYNDSDEFNSNMEQLISIMESDKNENTIFVKFSIIMAEIELKKFKLSVLNNDKFEQFLRDIINCGETNLINEIEAELQLIKKLYKIED